MPLSGTIIDVHAACNSAGIARHRFSKQGHMPQKRSDTMELKIKHLRKQFKDKTAVDDACITLTPGV